LTNNFLLYIVTDQIIAFLVLFFTFYLLSFGKLVDRNIRKGQLGDNCKTLLFNSNIITHGLMWFFFYRIYTILIHCLTYQM